MRDRYRSMTFFLRIAISCYVKKIIFPIARHYAALTTNTPQLWLSVRKGTLRISSFFPSNSTEDGKASLRITSYVFRNDFHLFNFRLYAFITPCLSFKSSNNHFLMVTRALRETLPCIASMYSKRCRGMLKAANTQCLLCKLMGMGKVSCSNISTLPPWVHLVTAV